MMSIFIGWYFNFFGIIFGEGFYLNFLFLGLELGDYCIVFLGLKFLGKFVYDLIRVVYFVNKVVLEILNVDGNVGVIE